MIRRALLLAAAAGALTPAAAHAGTYEVLACGAAGGVNNSWVPETSGPAVTATNACSSGGPFPADDLFIQFGGSLGVYTTLGAPAPAVGAYGYWRFEVPDPLRITASRGVEHAHSESDGWRLVTDTDSGELGHCQTNEPGSGVNDQCDTGGGAYGMPLSSASTSVPVPARWARVGLRCTIAPCDTGASAHAAGDALFSAGVTVSDQVAPSVAVSGAPASVPSGGAISATVSGSDQTGVARLELLVDGQVVASSSRTCDYTRVLPCENPGGQVAVKLASGALAAGTHQVVGRAYDAAGNVTTTGGQPVVANSPQSEPSPAPTSTPGPPVPTPGPSIVPTPHPGGSPKAVKLRISSVSRSGSRVRVRGTTAEDCRSHLTIKVTAAGHTRSAHVLVPRSGKWGVWVGGVRRHAKVRVRVSAKATSSCVSGSSSAAHR